MSVASAPPSNRGQIQLEQPNFSPEVGKLARVRSAGEILQLLSDDGCTDGLPFQPEMAAYCGKSFLVSRWATNVCYQTGGVAFGALDRCVILEMPRCRGEGLGDCELGCTLFWKADWLADPTTASSSASPTRESELEALRHLTKREAFSENESQLPVYHCQGSQLAKIVSETSRLNARAIRDQHNLNHTSVSTLVSDMCSTLIAKARRKQSGYVGPCIRTPAPAFSLGAGETVRVKPLVEIIQTLDVNGKNRGLWYDPAMDQFAGKTFTVSRRVTKFVDERTGKMIQPSVPSVVLEDLHCDGRQRRYCSRMLQFFWREIWLERT